MENTGLDTTTAELLQSAIHDLKGPASRIRLGAQLLTRGSTVFDDDSRILLKHIEDSAASIDAVAAGLRDYVELCGRPRHCEPVDLDGLILVARQNLAGDIARSGAAITGSASRVVQADGSLLTWLFQELLTNAMRFRSQRALEIAISGADGGPGGWYVAIADNGIGIEPRLAKRAFQPFKKLTASAGAGLGLTICRKIVELHGGEIWIEPREEGAEFRFFVGGETQ
jgi:signal transduction histidine kinase